MVELNNVSGVISRPPLPHLCPDPALTIPLCQRQTPNAKRHLDQSHSCPPWSLLLSQSLPSLLGSSGPDLEVSPNFGVFMTEMDAVVLLCPADWAYNLTAPLSPLRLREKFLVTLAESLLKEKQGCSDTKNWGLFLKLCGQLR